MHWDIIPTQSCSGHFIALPFVRIYLLASSVYIMAAAALGFSIVDPGGLPPAALLSYARSRSLRDDHSKSPAWPVASCCTVCSPSRWGGGVAGQALPSSYINAAVASGFCLPANGAGFNTPGAELAVYLHPSLAVMHSLGLDCPEGFWQLQQLPLLRASQRLLSRRWGGSIAGPCSMPHTPW